MTEKSLRARPAFAGKENAQRDGLGAEAKQQSLNARDFTAAVAPVQTLLSRLDRVRRTGEGRWIARCPAHDDRAPSLSVRELSDGRVLVHCFAGCGAAEIVEAVGLTLADLFPERADFRGERQAMGLSPWDARDALLCLEHEALVVRAALGAILRGERLSDVDARRLTLAASRVGAALRLVEEARHG